VQGETLEAQAKQFNDSQDEFEVKPVLKGSPAEVLTAGGEAVDQKSPAHLVHVPQAATQAMMRLRGVSAVSELMQQNGIKLDERDLIKPVVGPYSKDGKL
jgi:sn-glycerol 3-phosphate transport system substrate-binding protein